MRAQRPPPLSLLDALAERQIAEAQARGELANLPGQGQPLPLEDESLVPEELRAAYRLLRNAGCLPAELQASAELREIEALLVQAGSSEERRSLLTRLNVLLSRRLPGARNLQMDAAYFEKLAGRLQRHSPEHGT
ncbi:MAG: DUF1992 domain-containing protein [Betaproteobacteria bacterium]|nr:DUF1992 domain-containing protein [Betaproteobacteria bacterium]